MKITKKELIERAKSSKEVAQLIWNTPELLGVYGNKHISETEEVELTPEQEKAFGSSDKEVKKTEVFTSYLDEKFPKTQKPQSHE